MTDAIKLEYLLKKSKFTKRAYAKRLGISMQGLYNKLNNVTEFKQSEIAKTCELLSLSIAQRDEIFFEDKVDE